MMINRVYVRIGIWINFYNTLNTHPKPNKPFIFNPIRRVGYLAGNFRKFGSLSPQVPVETSGGFVLKNRILRGKILRNRLRKIFFRVILFCFTLLES